MGKSRFLLIEVVANFESQFPKKEISTDFYYYCIKLYEQFRLPLLEGSGAIDLKDLRPHFLSVYALARN